MWIGRTNSTFIFSFGSSFQWQCLASTVTQSPAEVCHVVGWTSEWQQRMELKMAGLFLMIASLMKKQGNGETSNWNHFHFSFIDKSAIKTQGTQTLINHGHTQNGYTIYNCWLLFIKIWMSKWKFWQRMDIDQDNIMNMRVCGRAVFPWALWLLSETVPGSWTWRYYWFPVSWDKRQPRGCLTLGQGHVSLMLFPSKIDIQNEEFSLTWYTL